MKNSLDSHARFNPTAYIQERNVKLRQIKLHKYVFLLYRIYEEKVIFIEKQKFVED